VSRPLDGGHYRTNSIDAYVVSSETPASRNASCRSRHLLHVPQCASPAGFMQDSVYSNGTPSATPFRMTSALLDVAYGASTCSACARPSESVRAIDARNAGVA